MKRTVNKQVLDIYLQLGRELFPIQPQDKRPLHTGWREKRYTPTELVGYTRKGANIAWGLGPLDLVVDVDPRNGGRESLPKLNQEISTIDLSEYFPTIQTGGGGLHYYMTLPERISIKKNLPQFPGIDFLGYGRYVLIAGCSHPSGEPYRFDELSPFRRPPPEVPTVLFEQIGKFELEDDIAKISACNTVSTKALKDLLDKLPVEEFDSDDTWFPIMAAAHHATQGYGLKVFLAWSLQDPRYASHEARIKRRWNSLRSDGQAATGDLITLNTIYKEIIKRGGDLPPLAVIRDFEIIDGLDAEEQDGDVDATIARKRQRSKIVEDARRLNQMSSDISIFKVLDQCLNLDELHTEKVLAVIRKRTEMPLPALRRVLSERRRRHITGKDDLQDLGYVAVKRTLANVREDGRDLVFASDGRFWEYQQTHWVPLQYAAAKRRIKTTVENLVRTNPSIIQPVSSLVTQGISLLEAEVVDEVDCFGFAKQAPPIINTRNREIHIGRDGSWEAQEHSPLSYLTHVLGTDYDPKAECPVLDKTLDEIFAKYPASERTELVRHLWEVIGYTIQPTKNIASWVLLYGHGSNGKTVILQLLGGLLGPYALAKPISDLSTERNAHGLADLPGKLAVIDDDMNSNTLLPDGILKKISENKQLTANPKGLPTFSFLNTAIPIISSNHWPKTSDMSYGLRRRALVIDFNRRFSLIERDLERGNYIVKHELSGALNRALTGLRRLRARKEFQVPRSCVEAAERWHIESNQVLQFLDRNYDTLRGASVTMSDIWEDYVAWGHEQGTRRSFSRPGVRQALIAMGFEITGPDETVQGLKRKGAKDGQM